MLPLRNFSEEEYLKKHPRLDMAALLREQGYVAQTDADPTRLSQLLHPATGEALALTRHPDGHQTYRVVGTEETGDLFALARRLGLYETGPQFRLLKASLWQHIGEQPVASFATPKPKITLRRAPTRPADEWLPRVHAASTPLGAASLAYLTQRRGLDVRVVRHPAFQTVLGTLPPNAYGYANTCFWAYDETGAPAAAEQWGYNPEASHLADLQAELAGEAFGRAVVASQLTRESNAPARLVVTGTGPDMLAKAELDLQPEWNGAAPGPNTVYAATSGLPTPDQIGLLQRLVDQHRSPVVVLAQANDVAGSIANINLLDGLLPPQSTPHDAVPLRWWATCDGPDRDTRVYLAITLWYASPAQADERLRALESAMNATEPEAVSVLWPSALPPVVTDECATIFWEAYPENHLQVQRLVHHRLLTLRAQLAGVAATASAFFKIDAPPAFAQDWSGLLTHLKQPR